MHYYQHHIGDYKAATSHLTNEEDIAYRRLLEMYYDTEQSIPDNTQRLSRVLRVTAQAVEVVLNDFFVLLDGAWVQSRCQLEISSYQSMKNSGKDGADKRWGKGRYAPPMPPPLATQSPPQSGGNANHEPITTNQEPLVVPTSPKARRKHQLPIDFFPNEIGQSAAVSKGLSVAGEFMKFSDYHQSKGNAMADWQAAWRTWVGNARPPAATAQPETFKERDARLGREKWERMTGEQHPDNNPTAPTRSILDVVDVEIKILELRK